jgi:hypothetical protein
LIFAIGLISSIASRSGEGRVAIVIETRQRDAVAAAMSGLNAADYGLKPGSAGGQASDADATGGRSKCIPARQLARSGRGRRKRQFPVSDAASRKIHPRAERRRGSASEARFSSTIFGVGLDHRSCTAKAACGLPALTHAGAAGAVKRPVVPHAPWARKTLIWREWRKRQARVETGEPRAGRERGAMMHVRRKPNMHDRAV